MMEKLKSYIKEKDWQNILNYSKDLSERQRDDTIKYLRSLDVDKNIIQKEGSQLKDQERTDFYANRELIVAALNYAFITCTRCMDDIKKVEGTEDQWPRNPMLSYFRNPHIGIKPLLAFYELFPPDYLNRVIKLSQKDRFGHIDFTILWTFYRQGWISFDEDYFVRMLFTVQMFDRDTVKEANYLLDNPVAIEKVFLQFYRYEIPVLDISKWNAREGFVCKKVTEFWYEVLQILIEKGYKFDRIIVQQLMESLLNNWKKPHLAWHIKILELLNTTKQEYLKEQDYLFALLNTGNSSLINFTIKQLQGIYTAADFHAKDFIDNVTAIFSGEKIDKSILSSLVMLDFLLPQCTVDSGELSNHLAVLFVQQDATIQEKAAHLMLKYTEKEELEDIIEPYKVNLRVKTIEILGIAIDHKSITEPQVDVIEELSMEPLAIPATWEDLLFRIGNFIRTKSAVDLDLFLEGLIQLQHVIPEDYKKQLKPYVKQVTGRFWDTKVMIYFSQFLDYWMGYELLEKQFDQDDVIPFLKKKLDWTRQKLKAGDQLPFLSTPTHTPFYIHPAVLVAHLLQYEEQQQEPEAEDLIVACNRLLYSLADHEVITLAKTLKGDYAAAILYFLGGADQITPTEETLPLWTQVTRIKEPEREFVEFKNTSAATYPGVLLPFNLDFEVNLHKSESAKWYILELEHNWSYNWFKRERTVDYPFYFYNTAPFKKGNREDIPYQMCLNPSYLNALLCRYIPPSAMGNEVREFEDCLFPLQFILTHRVLVKHSGWIYIAACLLFEKKISRETAAEYIEFVLVNSVENLTYLSSTIGKLIARNYAPVNRLIEYFERPSVNIIGKKFQLSILESCLQEFAAGKLPVNSKKIGVHYKELCTVLGKETDNVLLDKLKRK